MSKTLKAGPATITVGDKFAEGDICDLYRCTHSVSKPEHGSDGKPHTWYDRLLEDDGDTIETSAVLKVVRSSADGDLIANEMNTLRVLYPPGTPDAKFYRYLPQILSVLTMDGAVAWVMPYMEGYVSLAEILKAYPAGIDYRDLAWMLRRTLEGIGFVHHHDIIHGALVPSHIMVHPTAHGAKLMDWSYAVRVKSGSIKAYPADWKSYIAPEIFQKRFPTPATDIFMIAKCCVALLGGNVETGQIPDGVPSEVRFFLERCLREKPADRPQDAWELYDVFDGVLRKLVGKPTYRPFAMPGATV